ncbi:retrovirus-related pol polyprotein from transposon TNT 1-94 [Tanacetum coccineum]
MLFKFRGNKQSSYITVVDDGVVLEEEDVADQAIFSAIIAKQKFKNVDETLKSQVRLGDDKQVQVEGNGTMLVTIQGKERFIPDVHYALDFSCDYIYGLMSSKEESTDVWHQRYGHLYVKGLQLLIKKEMVKGLPIIKEREHTCKGCPLGKQARKSFPMAQAKRAEEKLELVHADIYGPMKTDSYADSKYFLFFIDDYSRKCWFYFLRHKSEAFGFFNKFNALAENKSYRKLKVLRIDRGEHNGIAERKNRTIVEMERCALKAMNLEDAF